MGFALSDLILSSPAFGNGAAIPRRHTGEGEDVSPALTWRNVPEGTQSFAIFCHDPDAPLITPGGDFGFVHWILYNIPASATELHEGAQDFSQGKNNFDRNGYGGPMPPPGHGLHHYFFWLLCLSGKADLPEGLQLTELLKITEPHVLGMNRLVGTYERT